MTAYRKPEWSDPAWCPPGLHFLTFRSEALGRRGSVTVFLPPEAERLTSVPMVLLLHGVYNSHWGWAFKGGAMKTLSRLMEEGKLPPCCLVMPEDGGWGDGTLYLNHHGMDVERWIMEDVSGCVAEQFPCLDATAKLYLAGFSMGGFGALHFAGKFPDRLRAVSVHSSMTEFGQMEGLTDLPMERYGAIEPDDQFPLRRLQTNADRLPPLRIDCGRDDKYIEANRALHAALVEQGIPHVYEEFSGGHTWAYWQEHLADSLRFLLAHEGG